MSDNNIIVSSAYKMIESGMKDYAKTTVKQRAIPDYRDGLKPVQRRILYSMFDRGIFPWKGVKKSAAVVGDVMARFHPHGDMTIFNAMVNIVHEKYPLIYGLGNWGDEYSESGAPRYIDCRLTDLAMCLFECIDIAEFTDNYSGDFKEPIVLPSKIPILLMNGTSGIAVGINVEIPPHNLREITEALIMLINNPDASIDDILKIIKGPDYKLGGILLSSNKEVSNLYKTGGGTLKFCCQYKIIKLKETFILEVFNYAPNFNKDKFLNKCGILVKNGLLKYASDDSSNGKFKISVESVSLDILKNKVIPWLNTSVGYKFYVTERGKDNTILKLANIKDLMLDWLEYQRKINSLHYKHILRNKKIELLKNLTILKATINLDTVYKALKHNDPVDYLKSKLGFSDYQAKYILECRVRTLAKASIENQKNVIKKLRDEINDYSNKLNNIDKEIIKNLKGLHKFFDNRRTLIRKDYKKTVIKTGENDTNLCVIYNKNTDVIKRVFLNKVKYFDLICMCNNGFYIVNNLGFCIHIDSDIDKNIPDIYNLISGNCDYLGVVDNVGKYVFIDLNKVNRKEFLSIKTKAGISCSVGFNSGDDLLIYDYKKDKFIDLKVPEDIKISRLNTGGKKDIFYKRKTKIGIKVISPSDIIIDQDKNILKIQDLTYNNFSNINVIGKYNVVIDMEGGKSILNKKDTLKLIEIKNFKSAFKII